MLETNILITLFSPKLMIAWYLKEQLCYVNRNICFSVKMDIFFESVHQHHAVQNMKHAYFSTLD